MNDFDRYDLAFAILVGGIAAGILVLGGPLWAIALVYATGATIVLYRHLPLPHAGKSRRPQSRPVRTTVVMPRSADRRR